MIHSVAGDDSKDDKSGAPPSSPRAAGIVKRLKGVARQFEFQVFLTLASALLFSWPFLTATNMEHPFRLYVYLYGTWAIVIGIIFFISSSLEETAVGSKNKPSNKRD